MKKDDKKIVEATLLLLNKINWKDLSLDKIKDKSKIKSFDKIIKSKKNIVLKINEYFDYKIGLKLKKIEKSNNKDMIFEILMIRFDLLQQYRKGVISIFNSFKKNPQDLFFLLPNILDSIIFMIKFTKISLNGIAGQLKIKGILIIYISAFFAWIKDDSPSLEKTMITLDKNLDQAGKILSFVK